MKYIIYIKYLCIYLKNSFFSIFGFLIVKLIIPKEKSKLIDSLKNKKVLVLGSGPSLDNLNQGLIDRYEIVFFLNNAVNVSKTFNFDKKKKFIFNSDFFRFIQLKKILFSLDKSWTYVFIPIHLHLFFKFIFFYLKKNVFLLVPKYRLGFPFEKNVTKSIITYCFVTRNDLKNILDFNNLKVFPYTVALNTFYFLISCKVSKIHYLGCDFSKGRSSLSNNLDSANFSNKKINLWINELKKLSKNYYIDFKSLK